MILIWALQGQMGRPGAGYSAFAFLANDGWEDYVSGFRNGDRMRFGTDIGLDLLTDLAAGDTAEMFFKKLGNNSFKDIGGNLPIWTSAALFWQVHGGVMELAETADKWLPGLKKPCARGGQGVAGQQLAAAAATGRHRSAHLVPLLRQPAAFGARFAEAHRGLVAQAETVGGGGFPHVVHRPDGRLYPARGCLVRDHRPQMGHSAGALQPRHQQSGGTARRGQARTSGFSPCSPSMCRSAPASAASRMSLRISARPSSSTTSMKT